MKYKNKKNKKNTFISQETQCMDKLVRLLVNAQHGKFFNLLCGMRD